MIRSSREDGTVLISTLLILSLMSAVALGLIATLRQSTQKAQSLAETAQADLYAQGAEAFAWSLLDQLGEAEPKVVNAQLRAAEPVLLPFENGSIALSIRDGTHCLRLGNLVTEDGQASDTEVLRLTQLFKVLGIAPGEATGLANRMADWVDADMTLRPGGAEDGAYLFRNPPNRTANVAFSSLSELRAVEGMTEEIYQTVRPYLCIGERVSNEAYIFNIDTATSEHLPIMAALLGVEGNSLGLAGEILAARPPDGYGSQEALEATAALQNLDADDRIDISALGFVTDRVEIEALITFGQIERARMFGFDGVDKGDVKLTYRDWGRAAFRPDLSMRRSESLGR